MTQLSKVTPEVNKENFVWRRYLPKTLGQYLSGTVALNGATKYRLRTSALIADILNQIEYIIASEVRY